MLIMENIFESIKNNFENHQLYRRLIVFYACLLIGYVTYESFFYANAALNTGNDGLQTAAIIAAIQLPTTWLTGFVSKLYWSGRDAGVNN